jgi:energy-coupling factor transport system ATP-binding protein
MIEVRDITFQYPEGDAAEVLRGVSFTLRPGEKVALMGANGSGKTTLARCLNGLLKPLSGSVSVDGLSTDDSASNYEVRRKVGMAFQNPDNQIVAATVEREIAFGLENLGVPSDEMRKRVDGALDRFHLQPYRNHSPHLLSGGERQRLALASIWVMEPQYLILDEPTSLLDPLGRTEILKFIDEEMKRKSFGVLMVTQFSEEASSFHRLIILNEGRIAFDDSPDAVFRHVEELHVMGVDIPVHMEFRNILKGMNADTD